MKRLYICLLLCLVIPVLTGCGKSSAAKQVDAMIEAIGDATLENEEAIIAAEKAYAALSDEEKAQVEYASFLPIYRNNLDILKQQAAYEALKASMIGEWTDLYDPENNRILIREDGTAEISGYEYEWTLNQNMETIRFEGGSRIVLAVEDHDGLLVLNNPDLMTCMKKQEYDAFAAKAFVTVGLNQNVLGDYFGPAVDLGPLTDPEGKNTGAHIFAFRSSAYEKGLIYFSVGDDFVLEYAAGKKLHGAIYEPYGASYITDPKQLDALKITAISRPITYIRAEYVSDLRYDSETKERVITLTNGIELRRSSSMNPSYKGAVFNVYDYLSDPSFVF